MIDLSYTNKDGLNLYEGFNNGFDYHRDGASEGDGYAHGGYPHIDGETSEYTDTSYKTGDPDDFFGNGNTFNIIPRSGGSGYEFVIKQTSGVTSSVSSYITSGEYFPYVKGEKYNIEYDGTLYENLEADSNTYLVFGELFDINYVGNLGALLLRTEMGMSISPAEKQGVIENDFPFILADGGDSSSALLGFVENAKAHVITVTSASDSTKTYTIELDASDVQENMNIYCIPETNETIIQKLGVESDKPQDITVSGVTYSGKWTYVEEYGSVGHHLSLNGYDSEQEQPIMVWIDTQDGGNEMNVTMIPSEISGDVQVTIPKM